MFIVTGGAGFIGSNLVKTLNDKGFKNIWIVDHTDSPEKEQNLNALTFDKLIHKQDFLIQLPQLNPQDIDIIFHQGACSDTLETNETYMMANNYEYSKTLLDYCAENNIRLIYASSASVYGNGDQGFVENPTCENPLNLYAKSKHLFDQYVRTKLSHFPTQLLGLRYFNVFGPQEVHKGRMASVIYHFHNQIEQSGKLHPFEGSDTFIRDFIYIEDIMNVLMFFYEHPNLNGIFNCGTGKGESFMTLANTMSSLYKDATIEIKPFPDSLKGQYQTYTQADLSSLRDIGYNTPFTSLKEGIKAYVNILQNQNGYLAA
ncbi:MAG: ADP-glyceromanno-heptose 6-epimerase [Candidatus Margulisbacteria bacterium]|nr:ADP-glyceromanno-heptose 6-epimerase [Candidatus Margulisiibacteriota bacterium]